MAETNAPVVPARCQSIPLATQRSWGVVRVKGLELTGRSWHLVDGWKHPREPPAMTAAQEARAESRAFEADVAQLLHLMVHSVYSNKAVFLRELISNAAGA